jgi:hypothetical protein
MGEGETFELGEIVLLYVREEVGDCVGEGEGEDADECVGVMDDEGVEEKKADIVGD